MEVQIYRVVDADSASFLHDEVCRNCASKLQKKGLGIEIDSHLENYVYDEDGVTYYEEGSDEENSEIECSICGEYLMSDEEHLIEGLLNNDNYEY